MRIGFLQIQPIKALVPRLRCCCCQGLACYGVVVVNTTNSRLTNGAGRVGANVTDRVGAARRAGAGLTLQVLVGAIDVRIRDRGRARTGDLGIHRILLFSGIDLLQVCGAGLGAGLLTGTNEVGDRDRQQDTDDQNDNHDLDKGKTFTQILQILGQHNEFFPPRV